MKPNEHSIAEAVRVEYNEDSGALYIVFHVTDEEFKNQIRKDWMKDIELKIFGRKLFKKE